MKTIYVVSGNHDGTLGVYSNKKAAWKSAEAYITQQDSNNGIITCNGEPFTYAKFCKKGYCYLELSDKSNISQNVNDGTAEISAYPLEKEFQPYPEFKLA